MLRKPFIEIEYYRGEPRHLHFPKSSFIEFWSEAVIIIGAITDIKLISDFKFAPDPDRDNLEMEVLNIRQECIEESHQMFVAGMYQLFLDQYGANYRNLPVDVIEIIAKAKTRIKSESKAALK